MRAAIAKGDPAHTLVKAGVADNERTAQRWMKAIRENNYRLQTTPGHAYTKPRTEDVVTVARMTEGARAKLRDVLGRYAASDGDVFGVAYGDIHVFDEDPVAMELMFLVSSTWLNGQEKQLCLNNGDTWDFWNQSRYSQMPKHFIRPGLEPKMDPMLLTWTHTDALITNLKSALPNADHVWLSGNHDVRYFHHIAQHAGSYADLTAVALLSKLAEQDILFPGPAEDRIILRDDFKVLHGTFARKGAGNSIRAAMEQDRYRYNIVQGHVHRVATVTAALPDGEQVVGIEMGCLQNLRPWWSRNTMDWQQGMLLFVYSPNTRDPIEFHNLSFQRRHYRDGHYLTAIVDGQEFKVKVPVEHFETDRRLRGDFRPVAAM